MMDKHQKDASNQNGLNDEEKSKKEMKKLIKNLDFMRNMTGDKRQKFSDRLKELIENFEANPDTIVQETLKQIKILKSQIDEVNMSLGNMQILSSVVKDKEYNDKNQVILEMLEHSKADPNFTNQVEEANPETRVLMNQMIKSLEDVTPERT